MESARIHPNQGFSTLALWTLGAESFFVMKGYLMSCRIFSRILGFSSLDVSSIPLWVVAIKNIFRHHQISPGGQNHPRSGSIDLNVYIYAIIQQTIIKIVPLKKKSSWEKQFMREILSECISPEGTVNILLKVIDFICDILLLNIYNIYNTQNVYSIKLIIL